MAWPDLPGILTTLSGNWDDAVTYQVQVQAEISAAIVAWFIGNETQAIFEIITAVDYLNQSVREILSADAGESPTTMLMACLEKMRTEYSAGNGEVTMDAVLTAMITADFDELRKFIGLVDAYRVALWNEPFNAEFYAALARGFTP